MTGKFEMLFEPIKIGNVEVKNRIAMPPMWKGFATQDGFVTPQMLYHYRKLADGGVGLIIVEYTSIDNKLSRAAKSALILDDDTKILGLTNLAETIKLHGATAVQQICHAGRQTVPSTIDGETPIAPSRIPCGLLSGLMGKPNTPREATIEELEEIKESFGEAARRIKFAGFDGVEIHGAHGYLLCSFLSPHTNKRTDIYGGDFDGRARYPLEVVDRIREKVGRDFPVIYRLSGEEYVEGGLTVKDTARFSQMLEDRGVDCIHVSGGMYEALYGQTPPVYLPRNCNIEFAATIKRAVDIPVITAGGITVPEEADRFIKEGKTDLVAMGRALFSDPEWPNRAMRGELEDIRPCIRCNEEFFQLFEGKQVRCTVNFQLGREKEYEITPAAKRKRVLIAGGGPAGMEAARVAALRGHEVILCEKSDKLGGNFVTASTPSFKEDMRRILEYLQTQVNKLGVKVQLRREVTLETVEKVKPDALVVAVGSTPVIPDIPGINKGIVATAEDVISGKARVGEKAVVAGGGLVGCDAALFIAEQGRKVTLIEMLKDVAYNADPITKVVVLKRLADDGVQICTELMLSEVTDDGIVATDKYGKKVKIAADTVVIALGYRPRSEVVKALSKSAPEVYIVGDCLEARKVRQAIHEGFVAGFKV